MTDSILRSYQSYSYTTHIPFPAPAAAAVDDAYALIASEADGFAVDATSFDTITDELYVGGPVGGTVAVVDTVTPANNLNNVAMDTIAGPLFQTGTSAKVVLWGDGTVRWTPHNIEVNSQNFTTGWFQNNCTVTGNTTVAPDGTTTADTLTATGSDADVGQTLGVVDSNQYTGSVYVKAGSDTWVAFYFSDQLTGYAGTYFNLSTGAKGTTFSNTYSLQSYTTEDAGGGYYRFSITTTFGGVGTPFLHITAATADNTNASSGTIIIWGAQVNRGFAPTPYRFTTSTANYGIPQAYDLAAAKYAIWSEPAATNLALRSDDFTNASWTKSNMSTAKTATAPDGFTTGASTLTASAGNATALQAITSGSSNRITSMWVKRRTGSGNIDLTQDNGSTWQTMTVTSSWTRVALTAATLTNPTVGIRIVTNGDAIDVWGFQHETGGVATSTIPTLGSTVTRAVDIVSAPDSMFRGSDTNFTAYLDYKPLDISTGQRYGWVYYKDTNNFAGLQQDAFTAAIYNKNAGSEISEGLAVVTTDIRTQISIACKTNDFDGSINGGSIVSEASASALTTGYTHLHIGGANGNTINGYIYRVLFVPRQVHTEDGTLDTWRYNF